MLLWVTKAVVVILDGGGKQQSAVLLGQRSSQLHQFRLRSHAVEVVVGHIQHVLVGRHQLGEIGSAGELGEPHRSGRTLLLKHFAETVVAAVVVVDGQQVGNSDRFVQVLPGNGKHDVLGYTGAGTDDQQTHIKLISLHE